MKIYYSFIIFMAIALGSKAQLPLNGKHYADSIQLSLKKPASDSAKARSCFLLTDYFILSEDTVKARQYLQQGVKYSGDNKYLNAVSMVFHADVLPGSRPDSAIKTFLEAEKELEKYNSRDAFFDKGQGLARLCPLTAF